MTPANPEHAERLLTMVATSPLSMRELQCWFGHYEQPPGSAREYMVDRPRLFIDTCWRRRESANRRP